MSNRLVTSSGILTNLDKPRTGVIAVNDERLSEWIHDLLDPNDMIDITYEDFTRELEADLDRHGIDRDEYDDALENYESDNTTYLVGQWIVDKDLKYIPDTTKEFAATYNTGSNIICVEWSKSTRKVHHTSPCYVMADGSGPCGNLSKDGEVLAYDLPSNWYREND